MAEFSLGSLVVPATPPYRQWQEHQGGVKAIAASPDGRWVAAADTELKIVVWEEGRRIRSFEPFTFWERYPINRQVYDLVISRDSRTLFVSATDRLHAYDLETGRRQWRFRGPRVLAFLPSNPSSLGVNPATGEIAAGFEDGHLGIWTPEGRGIGFWYDDQGPNRLAYTRDGRQLIGTDHTAICIWDAESHAKIARHYPKKPVHGLALSPVDDLAATTDLYEVSIWRHESGAEVARLPVEPGLPLLAISAERKVAFASGRTVWIADAEGARIARFDLGPARPTQIAFTADGADLLVGGSDGVLRHYRVTAMPGIEG